MSVTTAAPSCSAGPPRKECSISKFFTHLAAVAAPILLSSQVASAHCDAVDGPVVNAGRLAFEKKDVALVLRWVPVEREAEIRDAFDRTLTVRTLGGEAKALAETWFFETLVRIHRAGEGASFDGLQPAGRIEPFVAGVDLSLAHGAPDALIDTVAAHVTGGVRSRFARVRDARVKADSSINDGRAYVAAYVDYLHYVEALLQIGVGPAEHQETSGSGHGHER